jgi:RNA-directed DNA polymerase
MSLRSILASLLRTLTGGRPRAPRPPQADISAFESSWAGLLSRLGLPSSALRDVMEAGSLHPHFHYRHFTKSKRDRSRREIAAPDVKLKRVQHEILTRWFRNQQPHAAALAYRQGKSTADHAWAHAGAEVVITADVQDFFPSTRHWRIEDWWRQCVEDDVARLLTLLTTYQGGLPQGAPTSPALSNFVNHEMDERLAQRAEAAGARYTRYCDDLAFSWRQGTEPSSDFEAGVRAALHEYGYALHPEKGWRIQYRRDEPELVGVVLTRQGRVRLPDELRQRMHALSRSGNPRAAERLAGYRGYEAMISKSPQRKPTAKAASSHPRIDREEIMDREEIEDGEESIPF